MTIAAAYLVSDGVVLGGDSSTTVYIDTLQGKGVAQLLTNSQKVFEIGKNSRIGACTWGAGNIGSVSHRSIFAVLSDNLKDGFSVKDAAEELAEIVQKTIRLESINPFVGYYLGGWDLTDHKPRCFKIQIDEEKKDIEELSQGLCSFSGNPAYFTRVFRGYDLNLIQHLKSELKNQFSEIDDFDQKFDDAFEKASIPFTTGGYKDLPIREAIDFVYSYLHITLKAEKFKYGPPSCGGPIEVAFITSDREFRWVRHKNFNSAIDE